MEDLLESDEAGEFYGGDFTSEKNKEDEGPPNSAAPACSMPGQNALGESDGETTVPSSEAEETTGDESGNEEHSCTDP